MKKYLLVFILVFGLSGFSQAGNYNSAIGVRGGFYSGISFKQFIDRQDAFEIVGAFHYQGMLAAFMYQRHVRAFDAPGLNWYYGGGGHIGIYDKRFTPRGWFGDNDTGPVTTLGVMGVVGLEYKIEEIPITIGVDITPSFNVFGHIGPWFNSGLTLRYVFN